jgi:hypothetical protein
MGTMLGRMKKTRSRTGAGEKSFGKATAWQNLSEGNAVSLLVSRELRRFACSTCS